MSQIHPLRYSKSLILLVFLFFIMVLMLDGCAVNSDKFTARVYHDMNSRYNSYFLARERIQEVEKQVFINRVEKYNRVLDVLPHVDTTFLRSFDTKMDDCITKAANIKNRHENSKWLFPAYLLIGKARFYLRDYENALNTYKYVNSKSDIPEAKNQALIELMHTYIQLKDLRSAKLAMNEILKRNLEKQDKADFFVMRGHFYREQDDYVETAKSLGSAVKIVPHGEARARMYFILGQIYQKLERNDLAYKNYKSVLKNNPSYELLFFTRLYLAQVSNLNNQEDLKKIYRYYQKLLADTKNVEYQDKIYYEMGLFELRQNKTQEAIKYLKQSTMVNGKNTSQKAYSFLRLGEIQYANFQNYELAKVYYDSVMRFLPEKDEDYVSVKRRHKTLEDFVKQLNIYRTQDSLQRMARMSEDELKNYATIMLTREETRKLFVEDSLSHIRNKQSMARNNKQKGTLAETTQNGSQWYFYNPASIQQGHQSFLKKWGNRPLADNWRRASILALTPPDSIETVVSEIDTAQIRADKIKKRVEQRTEELYAALPKTEDDFKASDKKIEDALFELGRIYKFRLDEPKNSIVYFEKLLGRFQQTDYEPEALYHLYLLNEELKNTDAAEKYKHLLLNRHPNSSFARRINNPNYLAEARANEAKVKAAYKKAYELYELQKYDESLLEIRKTKKEYPDNIIEDKFLFLEYLIQFKMSRDKESFLKNMNFFLEKYPDSELISLAESFVKKPE